MTERLRHTPLSQAVPLAIAAAAIIFALLYVVAIADPSTGVGDNWRTTNFGSAIDNPGAFLFTLLDAVTFAGLLFIVASGFSLIFGLMRVVNMAHGSFYLLGGYIAYEIQQSMTGAGFSVQPSDVNTWEWVLPLLVAMGAIAVFGLAVQQLLLVRHAQLAPEVRPAHGQPEERRHGHQVQRRGQQRPQPRERHHGALRRPRREPSQHHPSARHDAEPPPRPRRQEADDHRHLPRAKMAMPRAPGSPRGASARKRGGRAVGRPGRRPSSTSATLCNCIVAPKVF